MSTPLVSTEWLAARLGAPDIRIADASWYLPQAGRDPKSEYLAQHIPGAVFFDIEELSDETSYLPHMLAPAEKFAERAGKLGIGDGDMVVVYDGAGLFSSARAWWMLRAMGHKNVAVLDGGLPKWLREGHKVDAAPVTPQPRPFTALLDQSLVRDLAQMKENLNSRAMQVIDARGRPRFLALEPEPRPGMRGGHIPGSINLPYSQLVDAGGTLKPLDALRAQVAVKRLDLSAQFVTTCGSGITAAIAMLALEIVGAKNVALYDGSWAEWSVQPDTPVETE